eukprot:31077-Pelagococcus_subviridis.AAC.10
MHAPSLAASRACASARAIARVRDRGHHHLHRATKKYPRIGRSDAVVRCSIGGAAPPPYDVERDRTILEAVGVGLLCVAASAMFANGASASRVSNSAQLAAALYGGGGGAGPSTTVVVNNASGGATGPELVCR